MESNESRILGIKVKRERYWEPVKKENIVKCPNCGNIYIRDPDPPEVDRVIIKMGGKLLADIDAKDILKPEAIRCGWCGYIIPLNKKEVERR